jgi:hypothetical protein
LLTVTKTNKSVVLVGSTNNSTTITNVALAVSNLVNAVNLNPQLASSDGCAAEDFKGYSLRGAQFNLRARTSGWNAAQIQAVLTASSPSYYSISPAGAQLLQDYVSDLEPRAHLYVTAGVTNLPLTFAFNTTTQPDGFHELTAVVYEGSHVRTQKRVARTIQIRNTPLSATFTTLFGGTNADLGATLLFSVAVNTNTVTRIELFSTGGSLLTNLTGQSTATFSVPGASLGLGLHPFYAIVTISGGKQYRTQTQWIRLIGAESPFSVSISNPPPTLSWPATAGRNYDVLSTTNLGSGFQTNANLIPSNNAARWIDTNPPASQRFYRIHTVN